LLFNFAVEYAIKEVQENLLGLNLSGTLIYADHVNVLGDDVDTLKENTQTLTDISKDVGLEESTK
jgi:hypothetical protein